MGITDLIAGFIQAELEDHGGALELQRSDLAQRFGCVPSQINYVMSTRFSPERGYIVESRRGGNGYIRITRVQVDRQTLLMHVINTLGDELDLNSARAIVGNLVESEAVDAMNHDEVIAYEIRNYTRLQRIKAASREENPVLEYEIRESEAILHSLGVNTDDLKLS